MSLLLIDLGRQVVADVAHISDGVLDDDGRVGGHAEGHGGAEGGGLGEEVEVAESELQVHGLSHVDDDGLVLLVDHGVVLERDGSSAEVARGGEPNALLGAGNAAWE